MNHTAPIHLVRTTFEAPLSILASDPGPLVRDRYLIAQGKRFVWTFGMENAIRMGVVLKRRAGWSSFRSVAGC